MIPDMAGEIHTELVMVVICDL